MKKILVGSTMLLLAAGLFLTQSCNKIKDALKVNVPLEEEVSFSIPVITTAGASDFSEQDMYLNVDSIIKANNNELGIGKIKSVVITSCTLELLNGDAVNNLGVLQSCKAEIRSDVNNTWVKIAEVTDNPDAQATTMIIPVNQSIDLTEYFKTTHFSYRISGTTRRPTTKEMECKATLKYTLVAGL